MVPTCPVLLLGLIEREALQSSLGGDKEEEEPKEGGGPLPPSALRNFKLQHERFNENILGKI